MTQERQAHSRNLGVALDELLRVTSVLRDDVVVLLDTFNDDWANQTLRRALVRASWAYVEGTTFAIKRFVLRACEFGGVDLSADEQAFLSEMIILVDTTGTATVENKWTNTLGNIKRTLKVASSRFDLDWKPDCGTKGWQKLIALLDMRHRVTHPKSGVELQISDTEVDVYRDAFSWFVETFNEMQLSLNRRYAGTQA